jgi:hypothetical protein
MLRDYWQQHNEHRLFFPQLLMIGLALLDHWNSRVEMFVSLVIAIAAFVVLIKLARLTLIRQARPAIGWTALLLVISLIWFSPMQWENWLWGWQIQWFLNVLGVVTALYAFTRMSQGAKSLRWLLVMLVAIVLAQFSLGNGTILWPVLLAGLLYRRIAWRRLLLVAASGLAATGLYYFHYAQTDKSSELLALHHPLNFVHYELLYFGSPLSFMHKTAMLSSLICLAAFLLLQGYLLRKKRELFTANLAWICLGWYVIGSGLITGLARLGFGVNESLSSRYITISSLLVISLLFMFYNCRQLFMAWLPKQYAVLSVLVICVVTSLVLSNDVNGVHNADVRTIRLQTIYSCTRQATPTDACLLLTYPTAAIVRPRLAYLKQIHWGGY